MGSYTCAISTGSEDYDWNSTSSTQLNSIENETLLPPVSGAVFLNFDTSSVPSTEKVTDVTLRVYEVSYSATRGLAKEYFATIADSTWYQRAASQVVTFLGFGNRTIPLPTKFNAWVGKGTGARTRINVKVRDVKSGEFRTMNLQAYEYGNSSRYAQLTINTTNAAKCQVWISGD